MFVWSEMIEILYLYLKCLKDLCSMDKEEIDNDNYLINIVK